MLKRMNFSNHVMNVFNHYETTYDEVKNLMSDLAMHREMFDEDGNKISKADAEKKLLDISRSIFGIQEGYTPRELKRAIRDHGREWFDVIEETVDDYIAYGMRENEFFNSFVNYRNRALGQDNLFWVPGDDLILSVAKVGTSHHDYILQRYNAGESYTVPVARYGAAVGADINRYMAGQEDWDTLVLAIARAFTLKQQVEIYNLVASAAEKLPVQTGFVDTGALSNTTKDAFDNIIQNVSAANDGADVVIFGTKSALKQISKLADVDWASSGMKDDIASIGRLGSYEGTALFEVPQRFADKTLTTKLFDDKKLHFFPTGSDNKLVDFFTYGETEIDEITEKGEANGRIDDIMKYEVQMSWGAAVRIERQFGQWTLV